MYVTAIILESHADISANNSSLSKKNLNCLVLHVSSFFISRKQYIRGVFVSREDTTSNLEFEIPTEKVYLV